MISLSAVAAAAIAPLAFAWEDNSTSVPSTQVNATSSDWNETGAKLQLALAMADGQLLPIAGDGCKAAA